MKEKIQKVSLEVLEQSLDMLAKQLSERVNQASMPVRLRNNKRWEDFAKICRTPIIGDKYFQLMRGEPKGLEEEPKHDSIMYFKRDVEIIEKKAEELEKMKAKDMKKWGDEIVEPMNAGDPSGYYTPVRATRRACYEILHLKPFIPNKWDFTSMAGVENTHMGMMVMESNTKEIIAFNDCNWSWSSDTGVKYTKKKQGLGHHIDKNGLGMVLNHEGHWESAKPVDLTKSF